MCSSDLAEFEHFRVRGVFEQANGFRQPRVPYTITSGEPREPTTPPANPSLPLEGIRILDLTMVWAGPVGTRLLADMGAEVIKVESARSWDMLRSLHFLGGTTERWWNKSAYFNHNNRNKYACTLDLQTERGRELLMRTPMKRFGCAEELIGAAVLLASDAASFITGQCLVVDGGFLASGVNS